MDDELKLAIQNELEKYIIQAAAEAIMEFTNIPEHKLFMCHLGLGLYIHNNILTPDNPLCKLFVNNGILHKGDMSSMMLRLWHKALNEKSSRRR